MKRITLNVNTASIIQGLAASCLLLTSVFAADMGQPQYKAAGQTIAAEYKKDKQACARQPSNAHDLCMAKAKGHAQVAMAELKENYRPSDKHAYDLSVAKADATFAIAKEECDDQAANAKDLCLQKAKTAHVDARADAKMAMKTAAANAQARSDAAIDKRDAAYDLAKQKCEALAGDAKSACLLEAKQRFQP